MSMRPWVRGLRPQTLPASVAPVAIGAAAAWRDLNGCGLYRFLCPWDAEGVRVPGQADVNVQEFRFGIVLALCAAVALCLQIAVNFANDYSDGMRGVDDGRSIDCGEMSEPVVSTGSHTSAGNVGLGNRPLTCSAPARLVASGISPRRVLIAAGLSALMGCVCGLVVLSITGYWWLMAVGACCVLAGWGYTGGRHPYGYVGLGELAVFVFFGLVAVLGTQYVLCGRIDGYGVAGAVSAGLLSCVMLMINNIRDITSDSRHGKRTLAVRLGMRCARIVAAGTMVTALVPLLTLFAISVGHLPFTDGWQMFCAVGVVLLVIVANAVLAAVTVRLIFRCDHRMALSMSGMTLLLGAAGYIGMALL